MKAQLEFVSNRDGVAGAVEYAKRVMTAYRGSVRYRNQENNRRHFCHSNEYRHLFVESILELRSFLREHRLDDGS